MALSPLPRSPHWLLPATFEPLQSYSVLRRPSNGPHRTVQVMSLRLGDIQETLDNSSLVSHSPPCLSPRKRSHTSMTTTTITMDQLSPLATSTSTMRTSPSPSTRRMGYPTEHSSSAAASASSSSSAVNKNKFRPIDFQTQVEIEEFFGQTRAQKRQLALHTKDEDGRWWFDGIEREENRSLLGAPSPSLTSSRRGSQQPSLPNTPSLFCGFDTYQRRSSTYLLSSLAPLQICTPDRAKFFQPHGILTEDPQQYTGDHDEVMEIPQRRTRMKRSHSASGRGNVIGDKLPDLGLSGTLLEYDAQQREDAAVESIRMPAFLPLPHRLQSSRDLDDAFQTVHDSPDSTASTSLTRSKTAVTFAEDTSGSRSRSNSGGEGRRDRPRPARLELTPRRVAASDLDLVEHLAYTTSIPEEPMALERSNSSRATVKGAPVAEPMSTSSSRSRSSSFGMSPISARKRTRPWSAYEMSPAMVAQAFSAMRTSNGRFDGPVAGSAFSFDSPALRSSGPGSSTLCSPSPFSPLSAVDSPSGSRFRSSSLGSPNKGGCSPSLPLSPCYGRRKGASSSLGLNAGTLEASKGEQRLGANPLNRNLLAPGGLATGEGVYDGLVIPCASVHLGSDDEDDEERKASPMRGGAGSAMGGSRAVMKKWLTRKKSSMGAGK